MGGAGLFSHTSGMRKEPCIYHKEPYTTPKRDLLTPGPALLLQRGVAYGRVGRMGRGGLEASGREGKRWAGGKRARGEEEGFRESM